MITKRNLSAIAIATLFTFVPFGAFAYASESWYHLKGEHFTVSFTDETRSIAQKALSIAEQTRSDLRAYLGDLINEERISIVLSNANEASNGSAAQGMPLVTVDCRKVPFLFRGETEWLKTVLTHELSHIYSFQVLKSGFLVSTYVGVFGTTQGSVSKAFGLLDLPAWFLEGIAQMGSRRTGSDEHDVFRRALLRDSVRSNRLLTLSEMARFEGSGLDYERAYNQGFAFLEFLETTSANVPLSKLVAGIRRFGFEGAFSAVYGRSVEDLYEEWKSHVERTFASDVEKKSLTPVVQRLDRARLEVSSADEARYVVANWGNDYERYALYRRSQSGSWEAIENDVGATVKVDPVTQEVWFSKLDYQFARGVERFDLYRRATDATVRKVTENSRSIAFDAYGGTLVYARYASMKTQIVRKPSNAPEKVLYEFAEDAVVSSISCLDESRFVVTYGEGQGYRLAAYRDGKMTRIETGYQIVDAVWAGEERVAVTTVVDGRLQIAWFDLERPEALYAVTDVPVAARFPSWSPSQKNRLIVSEFRDGGFRLSTVDVDWKSGIRVEADALASVRADEPSSKLARGYFESTNFVVGPPVALFELDTVVSSGASGPSSAWFASAGYAQEFYNAPQDFSFGGIYLWNVPISSRAIDRSTYLFSGHANLALGPTRNAVQFQAQSSNEGEGSAIDHFLDTTFVVRSEVQVADRQYVSAAFRNFSSTYANENLFQFGLTSVDLDWSASTVPNSVFDPAGLGQTGIGANAGVEVMWSNLNPRLAYPAWVNLSKLPIEKISGAVLANALVVERKVNLGIRLDGFTYFGAVDGSKVSIGTLSTIGGSSSFSGYSNAYASVNDLARAAASIEIGPFADPNRKVEFFDRWSVFALVEAGVLRYFDSGLTGAYALSFETGIRGSIYFSASSPTSFRVRYAQALHDFRRTLTTTYRVYFDVSF